MSVLLKQTFHFLLFQRGKPNKFKQQLTFPSEVLCFHHTCKTKLTELINGKPQTRVNYTLSFILVFLC